MLLSCHGFNITYVASHHCNNIVCCWVVIASKPNRNMGGFRGGQGGQMVRTPLEKSQNVGFPSNIDPDPLKSQSYQASIQWWLIIGTPAKRHFNDDGPLLVAFWSALHPINKKKRRTPPPPPKKKKKKKKKTVSGQSVLDPLWQNFLDPRMRKSIQIRGLFVCCLQQGIY